MKKRKPVVYYAVTEDRLLVKIGRSLDPQSRVRQFRSSNRMQTIIAATEPGDYQLERRRHRQFSAHRVAGEWFRFEGDIVRHVETLAPQRRDAVAEDRVIRAVTNHPKLTWADKVEILGIKEATLRRHYYKQ